MYKAGFFTPSLSITHVLRKRLWEVPSICRTHFMTQVTAIPTFLDSISILRVSIFILVQTMIQNWAIGSPRRIPPFFLWTYKNSNQWNVFVSFKGGTDEDIYLTYLIQKKPWNPQEVFVLQTSLLAHATCNVSSLSLELHSDSQEGFLFLPFSTVFPQKLKIFTVIQSSSFGPPLGPHLYTLKTMSLRQQDPLSQKGGSVAWVTWSCLLNVSSPTLGSLENNFFLTSAFPKVNPDQCNSVLLHLMFLKVWLYI